MSRFSHETEQLLQASGWFLGRSVPRLVESWRVELESNGGFTMPSVARSVLDEFGGLHIFSEGAGSVCARIDIHLNPSFAKGEEDRFFTYFDCLLGKHLFPLGEAAGGHTFVAIDEQGVVFLVMDEVYYVADSFDAALDNLLLGKGTVCLGHTAA